MTHEREPFHTLRRLLVGEEQDRLDHLQQRVSDPEQRTADTSPILPDALVQAHQRDRRLSEALKRPVQQCFQTIIKEDRRLVAETLFPVIGPAIRKSIAHALQAFLRSVNMLLENSFSLRSMRWRFEAWRSGKSFAEVVLARTLLYRVEHVFLIHRETGLPIENEAHEQAALRDEDAVAGMLTAIQDFVRDSFSGDDSDHLETMNVGDLTVWLIHGQYAMLAAVIRGIPPLELREQLQDRLGDIHVQYGRALRRFDGAPLPFPGLEADLNDCLLARNRPQDKPSRSRKLPYLPLALLLFIAIIGLSYYSWQGFKAMRARQTLVHALKLEPGYFVTQVKAARNQQFHIKGLRDPLATPLETVMAGHGLSSWGWQGDWTPFQSLEPEILLRRMQRAMNTPPQVTLFWESGEIVARGQAPRNWLEEQSQRVTSLSTDVHIDLSGITPTDSNDLARLRTLLNAPDSVGLNHQGQTLVLTGSATRSWVQLLPTHQSAVTPFGITTFDSSQLIITEEEVWQTLVTALRTKRFFFLEGSTFAPATQRELQSHLPNFQKLIALNKLLDRQLRFIIMGRTDESGSESFNRSMRQSRAETLSQWLIGIGVNPVNIIIREEADGTEPKIRAVDLILDLNASTPQGNQ